MSKSGESSDESSSNVIKIVVALIGAIGLIAAAFVSGAFGGRSVGLGSRPTVTVSSTPQPTSGSASGSEVTNFNFTSPAGEVPSCYTYYGAGKIPANEDVLAFDRVVDDMHQPLPNSVYSPDWVVVLGNRNGWQVPTDIGTGNPPGTQIELIALLIPKGTVEFLKDLALEGKNVLNNETWKTQNLPPSLQETNPLYVTFNGNSGKCT